LPGANRKGRLARMNAAPPAASLAQRIAARRATVARRIRARLTWSRIFRATSYARSALWIVPLVAIALVLLIAPMLRALDAWLEWRTGLDVEGAQALFQTVITLSLSFLVFIFGSLLVAIQVAGAQLTPRIIATTLLRDNVVRYSVGLFVFTLVLAMISLNRLHGHVYQLVVVANGLLGIACMTNFLFFIDYAARLLRPVAICSRLGTSGIEVIDAVYPVPLEDADDEPSGDVAPGPVAREVLHDAAAEMILALDVRSLVAEARRCDGVVELVPQVGDFLDTGEPLFRLYGGAARIDDRKLQAAVAFGPERTLEQDPMFAFRILVDIALKALSPAINDPTTAVVAIDQVHRLLRVVGGRRLRIDAMRDALGRVRLVLRTPDWEDYLHIACREIRACGASNMQVARRMGAMLDDLLRVLPPQRRPALETERALLERALAEFYPYPEDLALARIPDVQGLGGGTHARRL
jgi:uncharacterized membrane protein